jgi:O-antigen/teichoic acid export membrane protein
MRQLTPIILNQFISLILGILGIKLISLFVPPEVNGPYALFLTLTQLGAIITHSGLINHITRYWQRERDRPQVYARFIWRQTWRGSIPLLGLLAVILPLAGRVSTVGAWLGMLGLLWISNLGFCLVNLANVAVNASERHWMFLALGAAANSTRAVLPAGLAWWGGATLGWVCTGYALHAAVMGTLVCGLYLGLGTKPPIPLETAHSWRQELKRFGRPFVLIGMGGWALQSADRWVVALFFGNATAGQFALATGMASVIPTMASSGLMQWAFPKIFRKADQARSAGDWRSLERDCDRVALLFLASTTVGLTVLWLMGGWLVPWIISRRYEPSLQLVLPAGAGFAGLLFTQFFFLLLQGQHNSASMVRIMLIVALVKTVGSVLAALISWQCLMVWLMVSILVCGLLGRQLVYQTARAAARTEPHPAEP